MLQRPVSCVFLSRVKSIVSTIAPLTAIFGNVSNSDQDDVHIYPLQTGWGGMIDGSAITNIESFT